MSLLLKDIVCKHYLIDELLQKYASDISNVEYVEPHHVFAIEDSIHYNTLKTDDYTLYNHLVTATSQHEHSVDIFKNLLATFDLDKMEPICLKYDMNLGKYVITDGLHRITILLHKKLIDLSISLDLLKIEYSDKTIDSIKEKLSASVGITHYNSWNNRTRYGYHTFNIDNIDIPGQRQPAIRLDILKKHIDFDNKSVIDFGCNTGGMLLHLPRIQKGYGMDYSRQCIDAAKHIRDTLKYNNSLEFIVQDLNEFEMSTFMSEYDITEKVDIVFVLALGSWVRNWHKLYTDSYNNSKILVLETNNDTEGVPQLELFKTLGADIKLISEGSFDDTTGNHGRKTYIIT